MQLLECETSCNPFEPKDSWLKQKDVRRFAYDMRNDGLLGALSESVSCASNKKLLA